MTTEKSMKDLITEFEEILSYEQYEAEMEIEDFDVLNNEHWDEMMEMALDATYARFAEMGYTEEQTQEIADAYYEI